MHQRSILEVLKEFLNEIKKYNNEEIESILDFLPKKLADVESALVEVLEIEVLESQPVREGGASRGVKRPVSVSEDSGEDEKSVTKSNAKASSNAVEKRKKLSNEESDRDKGNQQILIQKTEDRCGFLSIDPLHLSKKLIKISLNPNRL